LASTSRRVWRSSTSPNRRAALQHHGQGCGGTGRPAAQWSQGYL